MRLALLVGLIAVSACEVFDPIAELPHEEYPDTQTAMAAILAEVAPPRVYAIGEYHPSRATGMGRSPLTRFTDEIVAMLKPRVRRMIVETWRDDCGTASMQPQLAQAMGRTASPNADLARLSMESLKLRITMRDLPITCLEHQAMRDAHGGIDFLRLLELVTAKLHDTARSALEDPGADDDRSGVIVYGGALHNDLYPRWPLDDLSYAAPLAKELHGGVLELDLVVPEVVAPMALVRLEPWFPLLGRASPSRVIVWRRGPNSYVLILPSLTEEIAKIARLPDA